MIALDTPTDPATAVDALFATDNFKAGVLIGEVREGAPRRARPSKIAMLDLFPGSSVGALRHNGFLKGFGHQERVDKHDRAASATRRRRPGRGRRRRWRTACRRTRTSTSSTRSTSRAAAGAYKALKNAGKDRADVTIVSVDGGCAGVRNVKAGEIAATSQQYPLKMASLGVAAVVELREDRQEGVRLHRHRRHPDRRQAVAGRALQGRRLRPRQLLGLVDRCPAATGATAVRAPVATARAADDDHPSRHREDTVERSAAPRARDFARWPHRPSGRSSRCCWRWRSSRVKSTGSCTGENLSLVLQQVMVVGVLAIGQTLIILTAGIDLSCGTVMALGQDRDDEARRRQRRAPLLAIAARASLPAPPSALLNGLLVTRVRLPPFIVTLGTLNIAFALTHIVLERRRRSPSLPARDDCASGSTFAVGGTDVTYGVVLMLALYALAWFVLTQTAWRPPCLRRRQQPRSRAADRHPHRPRAARRLRRGRADLRHRGAAARRAHRRRRPERGPDRQPRQHHRRRPRRHQPVRRAGRVLGTLLGALIVGVFRNGLTLMGVAVGLPGLITGILVILAVSVDQLSHRRAATMSTDPAPILRGARAGQALRPRHRARRRRLRAAARRDPRGDRRQRRRQVDADQGALRRARARRRARSCSTASRCTSAVPLDARRAGIETVYQDLAVAPALDIAENLFLGRELRRPGCLGQRVPHARQARACAREARAHMRRAARSASAR